MKFFSTKSPVERFHKKVEPVTESGCWLWTARCDRAGYGRFWSGVTHVGAHRFAFEYFRGPVPDGLELDHLCRVPCCVNPWHLEAVTGRINVLRGVGVSAQNARKSRCLHGHPLSGTNLRRDTRGHRQCVICYRKWGGYTGRPRGRPRKDSALAQSTHFLGVF